MRDRSGHRVAVAATLPLMLLLSLPLVLLLILSLPLRLIMQGP